MKSKKMFARLMSVSLASAMTMTTIPVKADNGFVSYQGNVNQAQERKEDVDTSSKEFKGKDGHANQAKKESAANSIAKEKSKYVIKNSYYFSNLEWDIKKKNVVFNLSFESDNTDNTKFDDKEDTKALSDKGTIQINNGKIWKFKDAEIIKTNGYGIAFESVKQDFIKEFVNDAELNVKVFDADGKVAEVKLTNRLSTEQIRKFNENLKTKPDEEKKDEKVKNKLNIKEEDLKDSTNLFVDSGTTLGRIYGTATFRIDFKSQPRNDEKEKTKPVFPKKDEGDFAKNTEIIINGKDLGTMDSVGLKGKSTWEGSNCFEITDEGLTGIKEVLNDKILYVKLLNKTYGIITFKLENKLTAADRKKYSGVEVELKEVDSKINDITHKKEKKDDEQNISKIKTVDVELVKSGDYSSVSMSAPTIKKKAEILTTKDGKHKLILHFASATINNILAWSTDLQLTNEKDKILSESGEKGNITTEFLLMPDRSAICIVDLPEIKETVYEGHIYSNVMDKEVALKISGIKEGEDVKTAFEKLKKDVETKLATKTYYSNTKKDIDKALKEAEQDTDYAKSYVAISRAMAQIREKLDNPFIDGDLFFLNVVADGTILSPASSDRVVQKWARVDIKNGKPVLTVNYESYLSYENRVAVKDVKVIGRNGETINSTYKYNENNYSGVLSFELPYIPDGGEFNTEFTDLFGKKEMSKLILDYSTIHKGILPELLSIAIDKNDKYKTDDFRTYSRISVDKKDDYTPESFKKFVDMVKKCENDLEPAHRSELTQDLIDQDINDLRNAKESLQYKKAAGKGNTVNLGIDGINSPANYYEDGIHAMFVGWLGNKIKFNNNTYKVLSNGNRWNYETEKYEDTGRLLIMADNFTENKPWIKQKSDEIIRWDQSYVRKYLNDEFYNKFNEIQKNLIKDSKLYTADVIDNTVGISNNPGDSIKTNDKVFIADLDMMQNSDFGFASNDGRHTGRIYLTRNILLGGYYNDINKILAVKSEGKLGGLGQNEDFTESVDFYPCMNLDKSRIFMTISDKADISRLNSVVPTKDNEWRMVLKDSSIPAVTDAKTEGRNVTVSGNNLYAAVIRGDLNKGIVRYFGRVSNTFAIPELDNVNDKLYVFNSKEMGSELVLSEPYSVPINYTESKKPAENNEHKLDANKKVISKIYTMDATMLEKDKTNESMANVMFAEKVDVEVKDNEATLKFYLAYPVPQFPLLGKEGSVKNFYLMYNGQKYEAVSDITTKPLKEVKKTQVGFGLKKGDKIPMQILTVKLPKEVIKNDVKLRAGCYVNVVMNKNVELDIVLKNLNLVKEITEEQSGRADSNKSSTDSKINNNKVDEQNKANKRNIAQNKYYEYPRPYTSPVVNNQNSNTDSKNNNVNESKNFVYKNSIDKNIADVNKVDKKDVKLKENNTQPNTVQKKLTQLKTGIKADKKGLVTVGYEQLKKVLEFNDKNSKLNLSLNIKSSKKDVVNVYLPQDILKGILDSGCRKIELKSKVGNIVLNRNSIKKLSKNDKAVSLVISSKKGNYSFKVIDSNNKPMDVKKFNITVKFK
ncbi:MAG: DUF6273 domain-containing protein [Catonella sp.]|uniref:DUF6273 domain-containing protein n=1 Tax=Catonella sp. TaxID=2382125 RepID=UPI003FA0BA6F